MVDVHARVVRMRCMFIHIYRNLVKVFDNSLGMVDGHTLVLGLDNDHATRAG